MEVIVNHFRGKVLSNNEKKKKISFRRETSHITKLSLVSLFMKFLFLCVKYKLLFLKDDHPNKYQEIKISFTKGKI